MTIKNLAIILSLTLIAVLPIPTQAAETVHLYLKANGADIKGESTQVSLGRANSIECVYYEHSIDTPAADAAGPGRAGGKADPQYRPIVIRKRIDKSTSALIKAIVQNQVVEGTFKFFRPNPTGDGTIQQFYTVEFKGGRVGSIKQYVPDTITPATSDYPPMEEITFTYTNITFTCVDSGSTTTRDKLVR